MFQTLKYGQIRHFCVTLKCLFSLVMTIRWLLRAHMGNEELYYAAGVFQTLSMGVLLLFAKKLGYCSSLPPLVPFVSLAAMRPA